MLKQRIITALVLLPFALGGFFLLDGALFALFIGAVVSLGAWEWARLAGFGAQVQRVAYAALVAALLFGLYLLPALAPGYCCLGLSGGRWRPCWYWATPLAVATGRRPRSDC